MQIEAKNLGFRYDGYPWLFRNVNFTIQPGEIVGLTAPSGFGKTSLCKILAGYEKPAEGEVLLNDKPIAANGFHPVQLIFQHPEKAVNPRWKMDKILHEGWRPDQALLDLLGIEKEWMTRWPNELSGGELQRFCVARALSPDTKFLIADEMTTMLDAITQAQIWHAMLEIVRERNMGMIVVSHEEKLVQRLCHRVINLDEMAKI